MESIGNTSTMEPTYNETGIPLSPRPVQTPLYGPPTTFNEYIPEPSTTASTATIAPSKIDILVWAVMILAALILLLAMALKKPR